MRVNAGFSRLLRLDGIWVRGVRFQTDRVVVSVALRRRRLRCPLCDFSTPHRHDRQQVESTWRHLDLGVWRFELRARLRRLECPEHGVRVESVPFARHASGFTRGFEQLVGWLATRTDKTTVKRLVRVDWDTVGRIIARVALMSSIPTGCTTCSRSGSTRSAGGGSIDTSPWSPTTSVARSCGAPRATTPPRPTGSSRSSASRGPKRSR
jgi:Helix-turn-helix domain of transposase family ISL3/zinc-finger of transposase IS204/IS1001/IS1096/IS1165